MQRSAQVMILVAAAVLLHVATAIPSVTFQWACQCDASCSNPWPLGLDGRPAGWLMQYGDYQLQWNTVTLVLEDVKNITACTQQFPGTFGAMTFNYQLSYPIDPNGSPLLLEATADPIRKQRVACFTSYDPCTPPQSGQVWCQRMPLGCGTCCVRPI